MTDTLLTIPDQKERLSLVYVKALAARTGFVTSVPELVPCNSHSVSMDTARDMFPVHDGMFHVSDLVTVTGY